MAYQIICQCDSISRVKVTISWDFNFSIFIKVLTHTRRQIWTLLSHFGFITNLFLIILCDLLIPSTSDIYIIQVYIVLISLISLISYYFSNKRNQQIKLPLIVWSTVTWYDNFFQLKYNFLYIHNKLRKKIIERYNLLYWRLGHTPIHVRGLIQKFAEKCH